MRDQMGRSGYYVVIVCAQPLIMTVSMKVHKIPLRGPICYPKSNGRRCPVPLLSIYKSRYVVYTFL